MNIVNERPNEAVQELKIEIIKSDYWDKVESALKKQRQKAVIPGFRQGNAPMGMIRKMYYKNFLADEINELVGKSLYGYLQDNKIDIIFEPLAIDEKSSVDFDTNEDFTFVFEFAVKPEVKINFEQLPEVNSFKITASENEITDFIDNLRQRFGNYTNPEIIEGTDEFITINYGEEKTGFIHFGDLNEKGKELFLNKKVNDVLEIPVKEIFKDPNLVARFLKIKADELMADNAYIVNGTIENIGMMEKAELNEDFFKKAFTDRSVNNEEELRAKAMESIENHWANETDHYFINNAIAILLEHVPITLPDDFIRRYLTMTQDNITSEILDQEYDKYANTIKWQLIESEIAGENNISVTQEDIRNYVKNFFYTNYFNQFSMDDIAERLESLTDDTLKNKEEVKKIYDTLFDKKMEDVLRGKMKLDEKTGEITDFFTLLKNEKTNDNEEIKEESAKEEESSKEESTKEAAPKKTTKKATKKEETEEAPKKKTTKKTTKKEE